LLNIDTTAAILSVASVLLLATRQKSSVIATAAMPRAHIHASISAVNVAQNAGAGEKPNMIRVAINTQLSTRKASHPTKSSPREKLS
jgi:hypothetical protein